MGADSQLQALLSQVSQYYTGFRGGLNLSQEAALRLAVTPYTQYLSYAPAALFSQTGAPPISIPVGTMPVRIRTGLPAGQWPTGPYTPSQAIEFREEERAVNLSVDVPFLLQWQTAAAGFSYQDVTTGFRDLSVVLMESALRAIARTGQGPLQAEAERLLKESKLKVIEIANLVGFENATHFGRVFRKATGVAPLQYRKLG